MPDPTTYDPSTDEGKVRLLIADIAEPFVFGDAEIAAYLEMEGGAIKLAAAQAIDTNATNEALASKVLRTQDVQTDGAKLSDAMRKHAAALRQQHFDGLEAGGAFEIVEFDGYPRPEHTNRYL